MTQKLSLCFQLMHVSFNLSKGVPMRIFITHLVISFCYLHDADKHSVTLCEQTRSFCSK